MASLTIETATALRRMAAKLLGEYPPPRLRHTRELLAELEGGARPPVGDGRMGGARRGHHSLHRGRQRRYFPAPAAGDEDRPSPHPRALARLPALPVRCQPVLGGYPAGADGIAGRQAAGQSALSSQQSAARCSMAITCCGCWKPPTSISRGCAWWSISAPAMAASFACCATWDIGNAICIWDLPVMCALQRFYLRNVFPTGPGGQPPDNLEWLVSGDPAAASAVAASLRRASNFALHRDMVAQRDAARRARSGSHRHSPDSATSCAPTSAGSVSTTTCSTSRRWRSPCRHSLGNMPSARYSTAIST